MRLFMIGKYERRSMNTTSSSVPDDSDSLLSLSLRTAVFGILICVASITAIVILNKCRKMVEQIRITSIQLCVANLGYGLALVINAVIILKTGIPFPPIVKLIPFFCLLYFMFLTFTGIDRLMSLRFTTRYTFWSRKRNIYIVTIGLYVIATCILFGILTQKTKFECQFQKNEVCPCIGNIIFVTAMLVLTITHLVSFICIGCIVLQKALPGPLTKRNDFSKYWKITIKMIKLGLISFLFVTPYLVTRVQFILNSCKDEIEVNVISVKSVSLSLLHTHQILSPIFILLSYHECRFVALHAILCCCGTWRQRIHDQYRQYYESYQISSVSVEPLPSSRNMIRTEQILDEGP